MGRQFYVEKNFRVEALNLIALMNQIVEFYVRQDLRMTVRQLYYQLVARAVIENTENSYKRITGLVNDAKLAGLMDWEAMEDRTRSVNHRPMWRSGAERLDQVARGYHEDIWDSQPTRVFVVVEKEALAGVLEGVCWKHSLPLLAARGYPSSTVLREFAEDALLPAIERGQSCHILHLGDHDPSGIDMTRDLLERLTMFAGADEYELTLDRIALNMDQIEELRPPRNPAKTTDARFAEYKNKFGASSWELDALKPEYLAGLVDDAVERYIDEEKWHNRKVEIDEVKRELRVVSNNFELKGL